MTATTSDSPRLARAARRPFSGSLGKVLLPSSVLLLSVAVWEAVSRAGLVNEIIVPAPTAVAQELVGMLDESYFWEATWVTMAETLAGFAIGVVLAWALGTVLGMFEGARTAFYPIVVGFQITPRVALAPLFLTWFGFGLTSKVVMAATICFFPVLLNVMVGMQGVDPAARTLMRSLGASRWEEYRKLTLPSSLPLIFAGIKNAITLALIGAIVAEFVGASQGMGVLIKTLNFQLNVAAGFAVIVALMVFGLILYWIVELVDAKVVHWRNHA
ncbi:ABC transporter permease [Nocardioides carbamazepini]|uniref:ABC transporter permease n=1 Tax=Nocardioides carbamazepini TaxID=2854259 RepID=UPI00214A0326|nr:ABC transporter permease [Nocardioides carbamazepini]MCR1781081.1 ABC transporter permease [Nocardioides carbamazepini]